MKKVNMVFHRIIDKFPAIMINFAIHNFLFQKYYLICNRRMSEIMRNVFVN